VPRKWLHSASSNERLGEEGKGGVPIRGPRAALQSRSAWLRSIARQPRGIVPGRPAERCLIIVQSHEEQRRSPAAPPRLPRGLERSCRRLAGRVDHRHLEGILAAPDVRRLRVKPALARKGQRAWGPFREKRCCDDVQGRSPPGEASTGGKVTFSGIRRETEREEANRQVCKPCSRVGGACLRRYS
jgi:hypothetical protein